MSSFTCASCQVVFQNSEEQRDHYRSDWHRYNLRRKTSDLPPVAEALYTKRLTGALGNAQEKLEAEKEAKQARECVPCRKVFASEKSYENHVGSKKHLEAVANLGNVEMDKLVRKVVKTKLEPDTSLFVAMLSADAKEEDINAALKNHLSKAKPLTVEDCIFCTHRAESFETNMLHMQQAHSLYIPDLEYVKDLPGLIAYLGEKVSIGFTCLYCPPSTQPFHSLFSVRKHMIDKGHAKIRYDGTGQDELAEFYDFTESYPIVEDDGDENFEDVDSDTEMGYNEDQLAVLSPDEAELILPNGRSVGHRAYRIYYKQNLRNSVLRESRERELAASMIDCDQGKGSMVLAHLPTEKCIVDQKDYNDHRKESDLKMGLKQNGLMKHFRQQLLQ